MDFQVAQLVKNLLANVGDWVQSWVKNIPWRRKWKPTLVLLPEKFHGQKRRWATLHVITKIWT